MTLKLSLLPSELLGLILNGYSHSYLAIELWKCGDSTLNGRLSSGLTHLYLEQTSSIPCRLPSVVYCLRSLRFLSVVSCSWLMRHPLDWSEARSNLPKSLETLKLVAKDVPFVFMNFAPEWTLEDHVYVETDYALGKSRFIDIEALLPKLRRLKLRRFRIYDHLEHSILARDLPGLPSKLTRLSTYSIDADHDYPYVLSKLPRTLTRLGAILSLFYDEELYQPEAIQPPVDDWNDAPPHLEYLDDIFTSYPNPNDVSWLPRSLTRIGQAYHGGDDPWGPQVSRTFPPLISTMRIDSVYYDAFKELGVNWTETLPSTLTSFKLQCYQRESEVSLQSLKSLPLMKELTVSSPYTTWKDTLGENFAATFPSLEVLNANCEMHFSQLHALPSTLRSVTIEMCGDLGFSQSLDGDKLPPNLNELRLTFDEYEVECSLTIVSALPSHLTRLHIYVNGSGRAPIVNRKDFEALPPSLTDLAISIAGIENTDDTWKLPPMLRAFEVSGWHMSALKNFPCSLAELTLCNRIDGYLERPTFALLPAGITHLMIDSSDTKADCQGTLSSDSFSTLKHLRTLNLDIPWKFPSRFLRHLPRHLRTLIAPLESFEPEDAPFLPPRLTTCSLGLRDGEMVHSDILKNWPASVDHRYTPGRLRQVQNALGFSAMAQLLEKELGDRAKASTTPPSPE